MTLIFKEEGHSYHSTDPNETIDWTSVTTLIGKFKPKFDTEVASEKASKNRKSKWYGKTPDEIKEIWLKETTRSTDLGSFYHNQRESDVLECDTISREGVELPVIPPKILDGLKYSPNQKLISGIYPEHFMYLKSVGVCGQADRVEVVHGYVNISDYKTNKEIKQTGYVSWDGKRDTMHAPISHLDNCNYVHYCLQMSIYMYLILKHNPLLKPGKMTIEHILFEIESFDEYEYPIIKRDPQGNPIIKEVVLYDIPYMKSEVISIFNTLK